MNRPDLKTERGFLSKLTITEHQALVLPSILAAILVDGMVLMSANGESGGINSWLPQLIVAGLGLAYILILFFILMPFSLSERRAQWVIVLINAAGAAILPFFAYGLEAVISVVLVVAAVTATAILTGRGPAYLFIFANATINWILYRSNLAAIPWTMLIAFPLVSAMITETIIGLRQTISKQMRQMETINRISHQIASTIEPKELIATINVAVRDTVPADTYFVGTLDNNKIRLEVFYDEGEFFPPQDLPLDRSLSGWVICNRKSLLLRDVPVEAPALGLPYHTVGQEKPSLSWMGVPLLAGNEPLGIMAVASYRRGSFDKSDLKMLESIAQQAALVMDNAYHHAEVEEQSRCDSLTQVYNHGHFLAYLGDFVQYAREKHTPLSLIMLDIDHFKRYNDQYGHLLGDQVLVQMVQTIQENVRATDIIGRWGGEEFAILLQEASGPRATQVAERIRQSLSIVQLVDRSGNPVPAPTVSQGIAVFPFEACDVDGLVHLADQRLYRAKARGRDQVEPGAEFWELLKVKD